MSQVPLVIGNLWKPYSKLIPMLLGDQGTFFLHRNASSCYRTKHIISNFTARWETKQRTYSGMSLDVPLTTEDGECFSQSGLPHFSLLLQQVTKPAQIKRKEIRFLPSVGRMSRSLCRRTRGIGDIIAAL